MYTDIWLHLDGGNESSTVIINDDTGIVLIIQLLLIIINTIHDIDDKGYSLKIDS